MRIIDSRLELFVDDWLIDRTTGVRLQLHQPTPREVALYFDQPWEGITSAYATVFKDEDRYRMYYRGSGAEGGHQVTCYAESEDGVAWRKPALGICEFHGTKENNIVWTDDGAHNFAPFRDTNPDASADERYKAVAGGLMALTSPDGLRWLQKGDKPIITDGAFDSLNLAFWDAVQEQYVCYLRDFRNGVRTIRRATSPDFVHWTTSEWLDFGDTPPEHFYTNATTPYFRGPHIYLAFPKRFVPSRKAVPEHPSPGVSDAVFMTSRDGLHWNRHFMEAFIRPGLDAENWTERNNMPAWGVVPTGPNEISIYYSQHYRHATAHIKRGTLRTDGFVSVRADYAGGEMVTKPLIFQGNKLALNYSTSAVGSIRVEIQHGDGTPIPGYSLQESIEVFGDEIARVVSWERGADVGQLTGQPVRLRFVMKDADVYSIQFRP